MGYDQTREEGYSAYKIGALWLGGVLVAAIIAVAAILISISTNETKGQNWEACLNSGATALECKAAVYGS